MSDKSTLDPSLSKICVKCGQEKPLSAFIQLAGAGGETRFSQFCAACRARIHAENAKKTSKEIEDSGTRRQAGGAKIGAAELLEMIERNKKERAEIDEEYHEERAEKEWLMQQKEQQKLNKANEEKNVFRSWLGKGSVFETTQQTKEAAAQQRFEKEEQEKKVDMKAPIQGNQATITRQSASYRAFLARLGESSHQAKGMKAVEYVKNIFGKKSR